MWVSNLDNLGVYQYVLSLVSMLVNVWGQLETISENMQRGDPWNIFENFQNFQKYAKGGPLEKKIF